MENSYKTAEITDYPLTPGRFLIEASAGTGKTFTIAHLVRRLVEEKNIPMSKLLVTTFSNPAAAELKDRIVKVLNEALVEARKNGENNRILRLQLALATVDDADITTIHGFCLKMLYLFVLETGIDFDSEQIKNDTGCKQELLDHYLRENFYHGKDNPQKLREKLLKLLSELSPGIQLEGFSEDEEKVIQDIQEKILAEKIRKRIITYDDFILRLRDALLENETLAKAIRSRYQAVFVDEFQDTSGAQFQIFNTCFPKEDDSVLFYMIGDPKQSIYGFRGADINAYLNMKGNHISKDNIYTMKTNYRSSEFAIESVNRLFGNSPDTAFLQDGIDFVEISCGKENTFRLYENGKEITAGMRVKNYEANGSSIQENIIDEIASLLSGERNVEISLKPDERRRLEPSDIAILIQRHDEADPYIKGLAKLGISASACRSGKIFAQKEAYWMLCLMLTMLKPSAGNITNLLYSPFFKERSDMLASELICRMKAFADRWRTSGFPAAFFAFLDTEFPEFPVPRQQILSQPDGERAMTNYLQIMELLYEKSETDSLSPEQLTEYLKKRCDDPDAAENDINTVEENPEELRLERDSSSVQIITIFASKGLEYPIVFIPSPTAKYAQYITSKLESNKFRDQNGETLSQKPGNEDLKREWNFKVTNDVIREQIRLLYVALTRAKVMTYLCLELPKKDISAQGHLTTQSAQTIEERLEHIHTKNVKPFAEWWIEQKTNSCFEDFNPGKKGTPAAQSCPKLELTAAPEPEIRNHWRMMSYSAYNYGSHSGSEKVADRGDEAENKERFNHELSEKDERFIAFPRGAQAGEFIHGILERLAYGTIAGNFGSFSPEKRITAALEKRLRFLLENNRFNSELQFPRLLDGLRRTLTTPLPQIDLPLCRISPEQCMPETEFYLQGNDLRLKSILQILQESASPEIRPLIADTIPEKELQGILNGIIDLIFEHDGKYYIVDWKTNYLGASPEDYAPEKLRHTMAESGYILQYHLYSAALFLQLKQRLENFTPACFGGVYYLFLRGMGTAENGIWFDRPPESCLTGLLKLFTGENTHDLF